MKSLIRNTSKAMVFVLLLLLQQACTPVQSIPPADVAAAYQTSGLVQIQPYTRTIFSTTNW
jgi:hypothetical protein